MPLKLNARAVAFAEQLIKKSKVDTQGDWASNQPNSEIENEYLEKHNHEKFGNWFLGENTDADPETKERYEFPIGNLKKIFRSGLVATEQRAGQYHHEEIKAAARRLIDLINE